MFVPNATEIRPADYSVDVLDDRAARNFIDEHHYLRTYPAAQLAVGLFGPGTARTPQLQGVAVFATPSNNAVISAHTGLTAPSQGTTLSRLVLLDKVPGNGESFLVARARKLLRQHKSGIQAFVSYSDETVGHIGLVYCALSAAYRGRTRPRTCYLVNGRPISGRTLSKVRLQESGAAGAASQITNAGASARQWGEAPADWINRLRTEGTLSTRAHPGLHVYAFPMTAAARLAQRDLPSLPYPRF